MNTRIRRLQGAILAPSSQTIRLILTHLTFTDTFGLFWADFSSGPGGLRRRKLDGTFRTGARNLSSGSHYFVRPAEGTRKEWSGQLLRTCHPASLTV